MQPTISIIVPVYKAEKYLRRCIDSILSQTFTNIELILVNDGSPDNSGTICDEYAVKDGRIKVVHKKNGGVTAARRDGVSLATGEWIMFVDADDTIPKDSIDSLYSKVTSPTIDIVMGAWRKCVSDKKRLIPLSIAGELNSTKYIIALLSGNVFSGPVGKIFRRKLFDESIFDIHKDITKNEDLIMNIKLAKRVNTIKACPGLIVYNYFQNKESASNQTAPISTYDLIFKTLNNTLDNTYKKYIWNYISEMFLKHKSEERFKTSTYYNSLLAYQKECSFLSKVWHNINFIRTGSYISRMVLFAARINRLIYKSYLYVIA